MHCSSESPRKTINCGRTTARTKGLSHNCGARGKTLERKGWQASHVWELDSGSWPFFHSEAFYLQRSCSVEATHMSRAVQYQEQHIGSGGKNMRFSLFLGSGPPDDSTILSTPGFQPWHCKFVLLALGICSTHRLAETCGGDQNDNGRRSAIGPR